MNGVLLYEGNNLHLILQLLVIFDEVVVLPDSSTALWIGRAMCTLGNGEFIVDTSSYQCHLEDS